MRIPSIIILVLVQRRKRKNNAEIAHAQQKLTAPMYANGVALCELVKVVIEEIDDRNAERIMRTEILDGFVIKSTLTDVPVIS